MKILSALVAAVISMVFATSCNKETDANEYQNQNTEVARKVRFQLYTDQNFSDDSHTISFRLFIQNSNSAVLWDSLLPPMAIKDIPGAANKLVTEKTISADASSLLKVGFRYSIQGIGESWFIDTCGTNFKLVDFNFR
jgi:hypothetical protein